MSSLSSAFALLTPMTVLINHNWIDGAAACMVRRSVATYTWCGIEGDFDHDEELLDPEGLWAANLLLASSHVPDTEIPF